MDVTSLLNAGSLAVEQKRLEGLRIGRNRTPWDAGGYSLPITTKTPISPPNQPHQDNYFDDRPMDAPSSPRHKLSDSRSSLSSFASSIQSTTHSRFSSMSTASGSHSLNTITGELISPKTMTMELASPSVTNPPEVMALDSRTKDAGIDEACEILAPIAENRLSPEDSTEEPNKAHLGYPRPSSPSDAILIKRASVPSLRLDTREGSSSVTPQQLHSQYLSAPPESHYQSLIHKSSHKRSASAPNIKAIMSDYRSEQAVSGHATPSSYHEHASTHSPQPQTAPGTPPMALEMGEAKDVVCMYIPNCDTGSQLRKAISHIFGRNKMCTRLIPQHVWVHYCRKHYQRSRYRNPKEYAKLQCDLVQQQIRRVHDWSMNNLKNDLPGTVQNWGLAVRKREQMRLDNISSGKRKRSASTAGFEDSDGEGDVPGNGHPVPPTAVPNWLLEKCGKGYNTHGILEIFNRLHTDILNDSLTCFPDIEILPNIIIDTAEEPKSPKGYAKRTVSGHKRSQSLGVAAKTDYSYSPGARRTSNPSIWGGVENPNQKRRRANEMENAPPLNAFGGPRSMRLAHRPVFHGIEEHQMNEGAYTHNHIPEQHVYQSPLPAPTPQRWGSQSMAHRLENEHAGVHRSHSRSRSDAGLMRGSPFPASYSPSMQHQYPGEQYRPSPYEQVAAQQAAHQHAQQQQQQAQQQQYGGYSRQGSQQPEMFGHHTPTMRHVRHQSSPMIHPQFQNGMRDPRMMNQYVQGHPNTLPPVSDGPQQPQLHPSHSYEGVPQMRNPFPGHR